MNEPLPKATVLIGPQSRLGSALNDLIRYSQPAIEAAGLSAILGRVTSKVFRSLAEHKNRATAMRQLGLRGDKPVVISAISLLGSPAAAFHRREMFADAEQNLVSARSVFQPYRPRFVVTIEPLHYFFFALNSKQVSDRLKDTPWEVLYELSWYDLVREISDIYPDSPILVVSPASLIKKSDQLIQSLFGEAASAMDGQILRRRHLSLEGSEALDRMIAADKATPTLLAKLLEALPDRPDTAELKARIGIDALTAQLLESRFEEDLTRINELPNSSIL